MSDGGNDSDSRLSSEAGTSTASGKGSNSKRYTLGSEPSTRSVDISQLEKDSEVLSRKAKKRLSRSSSSISYESFLEKLIYWQRKRKLDKIKGLLESLFPKLKSSEGEVKQWLDSVAERKEAYYAHGRSLVKDLEGQMQAHQHNLDFLDEAINDVKQIDYDIVKEITELKSAYQFNQEVLKRSEKAPRHSASSSCGSSSGRASPRAEAVSSAVACNEVIVDADRDVGNYDSNDRGRILNTAATATPHVPVSDPAVWQGIKECAPTKVHIATSPFTKSLSKLLLTTADSPRNSTSERPSSGNFSSTSGKLKESLYGSAMRERTPSPVPILRDGSGKLRSAVQSPKAIEASSAAGRLVLGSGSGKLLPPATQVSPSTETKQSTPSTPSNSSSNNAFVDDIKDSELVWGGAESKRRSLKSSAVSVQAILTSSSSSSASQSKTTSNGSGKHSSVGSTRPKGEELPPTSIFKTPWSPSSNTVPSNHSSPPSIISPSALRGGASGLFGIYGSHDPDGDLRKSRSSEEDGATKPGIADRRSPPPDRSLPVVGATNRAHPVNLSTLLKKLPDEVAVVGCDETDEDQIELCKRISKCRLLKDTLKPVLETLQDTHDDQALGLKKIKKMRIEMMNLFSEEDQSCRESNTSVTGLMSGYNSSSQSSTIEHVNSSNSLVHLDGAGSYPGSVSSVVLDMDVPIRPHTPPASHVSSNTLTFGTFLHHHHPNSSQYGSPDSPVPFRNPGYALPQPGRLSDIDPCLHEVAGDYVSDMKTLLGEERDAKAKLAKLSNLIDNALTIDRQLSTASPVPKVT